ncbi:hypothetical protein [Moorena producens]|uniref:hypothetical protein n=1 Tax=Moorena producens TaxID=1155739 RepID=UPI0013147524|nr:hypothetical protein [Moorena producens]
MPSPRLHAIANSGVALLLRKTTLLTHNSSSQLAEVPRPGLMGIGNREYLGSTVLGS